MRDATGPRDDRIELSRRDILSMLSKAAIAAFLAGLASLSMGMRFMRPKVKPFRLFAPPDTANMPDQVVAQVSELQQPWTAKPFIYRQVNVEYTPRGLQTVEISGYAVRLPESAGDAKTQYIEVYSRICPHLGCIFNFESDPTMVNKNYGGFTPPGPVFACPCHLSIYDLQHQGKVISGPAPSPPRKFGFKIDGDNVVVTSPPEGGLA